MVLVSWLFPVYPLPQLLELIYRTHKMLKGKSMTSMIQSQNTSILLTLGSFIMEEASCCVMSTFKQTSVSTDRGLMTIASTCQPITSCLGRSSPSPSQRRDGSVMKDPVPGNAAANPQDSQCMETAG